ncbi:MAG: valine--tRNA ligase, partial [Gammaproteobacteria bacterium]
MSKSKGNIIDPIDLIDGISLDELIAKRTTGLMQPHLAGQIERQTRKDFPKGIPAFGTDALRCTFAALASTGRDINFDLGRIEGYRNFCNKLWNASRYVLMNTEGQDCGIGGGELEFTLADRWIRTRLSRVTAEVHEQLALYRFDLVTRALYHFVWDEYCDWYLELAKTVLTDEEASEARKRGTRHTLITVLDAILRLWHPIMPFVTEAIWQRVKGVAGLEGETIMLASYPEADPALEDPSALEEMAWVQQFILGVRRIRAEMDIAPSRRLPLLVTGGSEQESRWREENRRYLEVLARLEGITELAPGAEPPEAATALAGETQLLIPLAGLIDKEAELARLEKEIGRLEQEIGRISGKLANTSFVEKAPPAVVEKERGRLAEVQTALEKLRGQAERIAAL